MTNHGNLGCKPQVPQTTGLEIADFDPKPRQITDFKLRPKRPFTGVSGPSGPEIPKKSRKESFWGSAKKSSKIPEKVEKDPNNTQIWTFSGLFRLFQVFSGTFLQTPHKTLFETFFGISGPEGPETPVNGRSGRKFQGKLTVEFPDAGAILTAILRKSTGDKYGQGKNNKLLLAENGPFGTPFLAPKTPRKSLCGSLFCVLFQEMRHINSFLGAQIGVFWVGGEKFMLKNVMCFFSPLTRKASIKSHLLPPTGSPRPQTPLTTPKTVPNAPPPPAKV